MERFGNFNLLFLILVSLIYSTSSSALDCTSNPNSAECIDFCSKYPDTDSCNGVNSPHQPAAATQSVSSQNPDCSNPSQAGTPFCLANGVDLAAERDAAGIAASDAHLADRKLSGINDGTSGQAQCSDYLTSAQTACGSASADAMGIAMMTNVAAGGLKNSNSAAVAASGQVLAGGTAAAMTYSMATGCMDAAQKCIDNCNSSQKDKVSGATCSRFYSQAKFLMYTGMAQGANAAFNGAAAYNQLKNNGAVAAPSPGNYPMAAPPTTGTGDGPLATLPNPATGMQYTKLGNPNSGTSASGDSGGSGGIGGGSGNPYPPVAGGGGQGGGGSGINNPSLGINGSGGGGYNVASVPTGGGGGYGNNNNGGRADQLDLSKFLPGQERAPANADGNSMLKAQGITAANELSNFEKVSRMMNKKRAYMRQ